MLDIHFPVLKNPNHIKLVNIWNTLSHLVRFELIGAGAGAGAGAGDPMGHLLVTASYDGNIITIMSIKCLVVSVYGALYR